jgi:hypothetical protein
MAHAQIINLWPTIADFASDIGVGYEAAKAMRRRGSIPPGYWVRTVDAAARRGIEGVDYRRLAELVAVELEAAE